VTAVRTALRSALALAAIAAGFTGPAWPAGAGASGPATDASGPAAGPPLIGYVLAAQTSKLDRLDTATGRMLRPITLSTAPDAMAIAPGGRTGYVLTSRSAVWAVNLVTGRAARVQGVGPYPYQVAFSVDGATAYVLTRRALVAVDVATRHVVRRLPLVWHPDGQVLQVAPGGHALFLLDIQTGDVTEVSTVTNAKLRTFAIGFCATAGVFSPGGRWLYLPTVSGVVAVNAASGAVSAPVPVGNCGLGSLLLAPGGKAIYAPGTGARNQTTVTKIDVAGGRLTPAWSATVDPKGGAVSMACAPGGSTLYAGTPLRKSVLPVSTATGAVGPPIADHIANRQLVLGGTGRYLLAAGGQAAVAVISTGTKRLVRTIRVRDRIDGFASLQAAPGGRPVFAVVSAGWLVPISATDGRSGRLVPADGQPARIIFGP